MYVSIGRTIKPHGLKGELKLAIEPRYLEDFLKNERIYIDVNGTKVPYFIEDVRGGNDLIVQLEDVGNRDAAMAIQSREVFLRQSDLIPDHHRELEVEGAHYAHLQGYTLIDATAGELGVIRQVVEMPHQEMAVVVYRGKEVMVPLNAHFLKQVDTQAKKVSVDLPEGLLEL